MRECHDFDVHEPSRGGPTVLFCRVCGEVRELKLGKSEAERELRRRDTNAAIQINEITSLTQ